MPKRKRAAEAALHPSSLNSFNEAALRGTQIRRLHRDREEVSPFGAGYTDSPPDRFIFAFHHKIECHELGTVIGYFGRRSYVAGVIKFGSFVSHDIEEVALHWCSPL